jgi:hypothetical protein
LRSLDNFAGCNLSDGYRIEHVDTSGHACSSFVGFPLVIVSPMDR